MIRIPPELKESRLSMTETAELISMDPSHLRRLIRRGILPNPKRTAKGKPFLDYDLLCQIAHVMKTGVGLSGEEILFYRRKPKQPKQRQTKAAERTSQEKRSNSDPYLMDLIEGCKQVGVQGNDPASYATILAELWGNERPSLEQAIPAVARRLLRQA